MFLLVWLFHGGASTFKARSEKLPKMKVIGTELYGDYAKIGQQVEKLQNILLKAFGIKKQTLFKYVAIYFDDDGDNSDKEREF